MGGVERGKMKILNLYSGIGGNGSYGVITLKLQQLRLTKILLVYTKTYSRKTM